MKKILLAATFLILALTSKAQTVNDIPFSEIDVDYVSIIGTTKLLSTKLTIQIDFGQRTKFFSSGKETVVKDENGKKLEFNSMIDALNFMSKNGYEFVNAYAITISSQNVFNYLLRKEKSKVSQ